VKERSTERAPERDAQHLRADLALLEVLIERSSNAVWCCALEPPARVDLPEDELVERILRARLVRANSATAGVFRRNSLAEILGLSMTEIAVAPLEDQARSVRELVRRGFALGEARADRTSGGGLRRVTHQVLGAVRDGRLEAVWGISIDRTEHAHVESELARGRTLLDAVLHTSVAAIVVLDPDGRIVVANPAAESILGLARHQILQRTYDDPSWHSTGPDGKPIRDEDLPFRRALASAEPVHDVRMGIEWPSGERKLLSVDAAAIRDPAGRATAVVASVVDVTERERASRALRENQEWLRLAFEGALMGTWSHDPATGEVRWSERTAALFGLSPAQAPRHFAGVVERIAPQDRERVERTARSAIEGKTDDFVVEYRTRWPDGSLHWIEARGRVLRSAEGAVQRLTGVAMDIEARRQLQERVERTSRVESIGRLAGGVAHDFNNLLTAILGFGELAQSALEPGSGPHAHLERMLEAAQRGAALVRQLLAFARQQPARAETLDLNELIGGVVRFLPRLLGEPIDVVAELARDLPPVTVDASQIEQVLVNLAVNARDAMPHGGRLQIATAREQVDEAHAQRHPDATPGEYCVLAVSDAGHGMRPEVAARVFEPFFTTKPVGQGTGLGLSTCYGIARAHGGWIEVDSALGRGSTFRVFLPRSKGERRAPAKSAPALAPDGRGELLLVVEDDPAIRSLLAATLPALGYDVRLASDGEEALAAASASARPVELLVTDLVMPRLGGRELARRLRVERPDLRVLFVSGYDAQGELQREPLGRSEAFLAKPYSTAQLAARVRELLRGR
jgi:two-component system cell cycle sensor histidine kinase/response regulator CckA